MDGSHRKLAHRGSCEGRVWVSPATVRRVMAAHVLLLAARPQTPREPKRDLPEWLVLEPNRIWAWDVTHFSRTRRCVFAIIDNGPPATPHATREFMALMAIWQHRGRPHTPTDQGVIESLFGHVKASGRTALQLLATHIARTLAEAADGL